MNDDLDLLELEAQAIDEARPSVRLTIAIVELMQMSTVYRYKA
jgi:hypothetical protein